MATMKYSPVLQSCSIWFTTKLKAATTIGNSIRGYRLKEDLEELFGNRSTYCFEWGRFGPLRRYLEVRGRARGGR